MDVVLDTSTSPVTPPAQEVPSTPISVVTESAEAVSEVDQELSSQDIEVLEDVLEKIAEEKKIDIDKTSLDALKEDVDEYQEVSNRDRNLMGYGH